MAIRAVMFDFGGVVTTSPFEAFARLEVERGLPAGFIRTVNATNPDDNAWARLERRFRSLNAWEDWRGDGGCGTWEWLLRSWRCRSLC